MKQEEEEKSEVFYMVYCPERGAPTHRHYTKEEAQKEAERLCRKHATTFYILRTVRAVKASVAYEWRELDAE